MLCAGTGCVSNGTFAIKEVLERELEKHNLQEEVAVIMTGCNGFCAQGPLMVVQPDGIFYQYLTTENISHLVEEHFLKGRPVKKLMYVPPGEESPIPELHSIPFFKDQRLIAMRNRGMIDPDNIEEYIARDNPTAAIKFVDELITIGESIVNKPEKGRIVPELSIDNIREIIHKNYRIVYIIKKNSIDILTVFEAHRLLRKDKILGS